MRRILTYISTLLLIYGCTTPQAKQKPYAEDWEDLNRYPQAEWLNDLKFGMYFHWNYNSITEVDGGYGMRMYNTEHKAYKSHLEKYGDPAKFGYKDFAPMFTAEKFSAKEWADNLERAGGKFLVGMAVHHDGFDLYDSSFTPWNSVDKPPHIDIMGELAKEARARGMKFGATTHLAWNWLYFSTFMYPNKFDAAEAPELYNIHDPKGSPSPEFVQEWYNRTTELIDKYKLDFLWFDFGTQHEAYAKDYTRKLTAHYYNRSLEWGKTVAMASKIGFQNDKSKVRDVEQGKLGYIRYPQWMADCTMNDGWFDLSGKVANATEPTGHFWLHQLIDIASKNGTLLLNLGPEGDGSWPVRYKNELFKMGDWLKVNGEAIYYTKPWHRYGEGTHHYGDASFYKLGTTYTADDVRFTRGKDCLYAIVMGWKEGEVNIHSLGLKEIPGLDIKKITYVATGEEAEWELSKENLSIQLPKADSTQYAYAYKIEGEGLFPTREDEYLNVHIKHEGLPDVAKVVISIEGEAQLALAEVFVKGDAKFHWTHDYAVEASSVQGDCVATLAIDENTNEHPDMHTTAMTQQEANPSFTVSLKKPIKFTALQLFPSIQNRKDFLEKGSVKLLDKDGKVLKTYNIKEEIK